MKKFAIVFATDSNFLLPLTVAAHSAASHCENPIDIVILYLHVNEIDRRKVTLLLKNASKHEVGIEWIELDKTTLDKFPIRLKHVNLMTYARLFAPLLLKDKYQHILYIDCDVVVNMDLSRADHIETGEFVVAAVRDFIAPCWSSGSAMPYITSHQPSRSQEPFFNAGVLLIDVARWSREVCSQKCFDYVAEYKDYISSDQDALNFVLKDKWCSLPPKYNFQVGGTTQASCEVFSEEELAAITDTDIRKSILHFCSSKKPWNSGLRQGRVEAGIWLKALRSTNYFSVPSMMVYRVRRSFRMMIGIFVNSK